MSEGSRTIEVGYLARVEGEGALRVRYDDNGVQDVQLKIYEPPRFFEAFMQGRDFREAPDVTARICGICPVAYQMSSVRAMERILGLEIDPAVAALRRLLYCGEWIESHVLHMAMLHAPDFLDVHDAIELAREYPQQVKLALALKKTGNAIVSLLGGREIHPINVRVGGFYALPTQERLDALRAELDAALQQAIELTRWVAELDHPDFERAQEPYLFVGLRGCGDYPMYEGRLASSDGLDIDADDFEVHFHERQLPHSNALHCMTRDGRAYFVGPLARFNLNFDQLAAPARELAEELGFRPPCINPFQSIVIRGLEVVHAVAEAMRLLDAYRAPPEPFREAAVRAGRGCAITEAPRGILYHRYEINGDGSIRNACIVPPTSQNQKTIEDDLRLMLPALLGQDEDVLRHRCEQAIRNYDPCISCATHFLRLTLEQS